jgi:hypothetical protein
VREDYVGTMDDLTSDAICGIGETLCGYHMEYMVQGKMHIATPSIMYAKYLWLAYLLPEDSRKWDFTLYDILFSALAKKI